MVAKANLTTKPNHARTHAHTSTPAEPNYDFGYSLGDTLHVFNNHFMDREQATYQGLLRTEDGKLKIKAKLLNSPFITTWNYASNLPLSEEHTQEQQNSGLPWTTRQLIS